MCLPCRTENQPFQYLKGIRKSLNQVFKVEVEFWTRNKFGPMPLRLPGVVILHKPECSKLPWTDMYCIDSIIYLIRVITICKSFWCSCAEGPVSRGKYQNIMMRAITRK